MNKNTAKIKDGISRLAGQTMQIVSGIVVPGSINESLYTVSVLLTDGTQIKDVMLNTITGSDKSIVLIPKDNSNVVIGCVDGPGMWTVLKAGEASKINMTIGNVKYTMDDSNLVLKNDDSVFDVGNTVFKMNTSSESLFQWLNDLLTAINAITVTTAVASFGSPTLSGIPNNSTAFTGLSTRLSNLLGT